MSYKEDEPFEKIVRFIRSKLSLFSIAAVAQPGTAQIVPKKTSVRLESLFPKGFLGSNPSRGVTTSILTPISYICIAVLVGDHEIEKYKNCGHLYYCRCFSKKDSLGQEQNITLSIRSEMARRSLKSVDT